METGLRFGLLGPLEVLAGGQAVHVGGARQRVVLAMLLLEAGRVVQLERLIDAVWDDQPPATARSQVQIAVSELRRRLGGPALILTHPTGYLVRLPEHALDVTRFRQLAAEGREAARRGDAAAATVALRASLGLWRGDAAAGIGSRLVQGAAVRLNEERLAVVEECVGLELALGLHQTVIGELRELLTRHPFRERLHAHLMLALYRSGRQAEALAAYREAHRLLADDHGLDPGGELRALERAILDNHPALDPPAAPAVLERIVPRQLPAAPLDFVGRAAEVELVGSLLSRTGEPTGPATDGVPVLITGPGGVGKTALALHSAHGARQHFPDGQLFAHLRGSDVHPLRPESVLDQFLRALGVPPDMLPTDLGELAALYRSRLADQRVLVVLDDAGRADQVVPLIPGHPDCAVVVTSRGPLPGLHGAERLELEVLPPESSMALLLRVLGEGRVRAETEAAGLLADSCGHLPLALRIAAAKLSVRRHWPIARMVSRLGDERRRLDELTLDGVGVRASISMSYRTLKPPASRLLLLLSMFGGGDFGGWVGGPLLDVGAGAADILDELVEARLVDVSVDPRGRARFRLHDLIRIFAWETLAIEVPPSARGQAQQRLLRCWLFLVREAHRRHYGGHFTILCSRAEPWVLPTEIVDEVVADPIEWFETERSNLVSAISLAAQLREDELCWELAMASVTFFEARADRDAWRETHEIALTAVRQAGNERGDAAMRYSRGSLALVEQRLDDAEVDLSAAMAWFEQAGDAHGRGLAQRNLAFIDRLQGRYDAALDRYTRALADLRSVGDRGAEAHALGNMAQVHLERGQHSQAERLLTEALAICGDIGARRLEAQLRYRVGELHFERHDLAAAEAAFRAVLATTGETDDPVGRAYALLGLGRVRLAHRDLPAAEAALGEALALMQQTGHRLGVGQARLALAEAALEAGNEAVAASRLEDADATLAQIGAAIWTARAVELRDRLRSGRKRTTLPSCDR